METIVVEWLPELYRYMVIRFGEEHFDSLGAHRWKDCTLLTVRIRASPANIYGFGLTVGAWIERNLPDK